MKQNLKYKGKRYPLWGQDTNSHILLRCIPLNVICNIGTLDGT